MKRNTYIDFLAYYGIGSAHPGGFTLTKQLLAQLPFRHGANVLEIGCGTGKTAAYMVRNFGYKVTAVENNGIMIRKAKDRWSSEGIDIQLIEGKAEQLPCLHDSFEFVLGESILAFTEKERVISECYRVLQKDGKLVVIEMIINAHIGREEEEKIAQLYGMKELLTENEWVQLFQKANFKKNYNCWRWHDCRNDF